MPNFSYKIKSHLDWMPKSGTPMNKGLKLIEVAQLALAMGKAARKP